MFVREPDVMNNMMGDPVGRGLLATAVVLELIGILVFRKIIKIHI
jgi:Flp pilus assembly protein TadB